MIYENYFKHEKIGFFLSKLFVNSPMFENKTYENLLFMLP
ncbi:hypothetical protein HMPREF0496_0397 [Lentilactobacillus hilgardii ATCC 27305]|nr:hypothetical protein HMPREF0496_0397 [Lentilactobacillus hilgardii ATCC 27305]